MRSGDSAKNSTEGSRRGWLLLVVGGVWIAGGLGLWWLARAWVWREISVQAERHGARLSDCSLGLSLRSIALGHCALRLLPDAGKRGWPLGGVAVEGRIEHIDIELAGLSPARVRVQGAQLVAVGQPRLLDLLRSGSEPVRASLPIDVEQSTLAWSPEAGGAPKLILSELAHEAAAGRVLAKLDIPGRAQGDLLLGPDGAQVTLGDPSRPALRFQARFNPDAVRTELSLELRRWPLRDIEGPWLALTDTLRAIELDGRIAVNVPVGLSMDMPGGDLHLTLHGLQFPVPREVEGLVHGSPPKISSKFSMSRSLDRATFASLSFLTGALNMNGEAEVRIAGPGLAFRSSSSGPLPCHAIAAAAARAHAGSAVAKWAGQFAKRALSGSVEIVAALEGHTSELERSHVLTTIGIGCGLKPLPIDLRVTRELLKGVPEEVLRQMPRLEKLPNLPPGLAPPPGLIPDTLSWPPLPPVRAEQKLPQAFPLDGH